MAVPAAVPFVIERGPGKGVSIPLALLQLPEVVDHPGVAAVCMKRPLPHQREGQGRAGGVLLPEGPGQLRDLVPVLDLLQLPGQMLQPGQA